MNLDEKAKADLHRYREDDYNIVCRGGPALIWIDGGI